MTNPEVAILMLCLFIVLVLLGFPIAFTLIAMGVGFGYYAYYQAPESFGDLFNNQIFYLLNQNTYSVMENDTLVAIPLFLFMGYVVERADIVGRLFRSLQMAAHNLPGSMAIAALVTCAVFSTASGIVGAVVTLMGLLAYPAMANANYDKKFAAGVICAGGTLGILIPPSIMLIVYAAIAELSPLRLYAAAMFPGLLLAGLYIVLAIIRVMINPSIAPKPAKETIPPAIEIYKDLLFLVCPAHGTYYHSAGIHLRGAGNPGRSRRYGCSWVHDSCRTVQGPDVAKDPGERVLVREGDRDGVLVVRRFVDVCIDFFIPRWSRRHRALGTFDGASALAVPCDGANNHICARLAA